MTNNLHVLDNKFEQICNDCFHGLVEMKVDYKARDLNLGEYKIKQNALEGQVQGRAI